MRDMTLFSLLKSLRALEKSTDRFFPLIPFLKTIHLFLLVNNDTFESKNKAREKCEKNQRSENMPASRPILEICICWGWMKTLENSAAGPSSIFLLSFGFLSSHLGCKVETVIDSKCKEKNNKFFESHVNVQAWIF